MVTKEISKRAQRVYREAIVIDMLEVMYPAKDIGYFETLVDAGTRESCNNRSCEWQEL